MALAGVALLGLSIGILGDTPSPYERRSPGGKGTPVPMDPAMARAGEARPLAPDVLPPSSSPAALADASGAAKPAEEAADANAKAGSERKVDAETLPELYAPPEPSQAAPSRPLAADDPNLPPF